MLLSPDSVHQHSAAESMKGPVMKESHARGRPGTCHQAVGLQPHLAPSLFDKPPVSPDPPPIPPVAPRLHVRSPHPAPGALGQDDICDLITRALTARRRRKGLAQWTDQHSMPAAFLFCCLDKTLHCKEPERGNQQQPPLKAPTCLSLVI